MGFWNKLGKVALTAAPYVAAPFTGGASLMATGLANKAVQKWSESDAKKAIAKGLAPSKFDSVLGKVGTISSLASSVIPTNALGAVGMLGSAGKAASAASKVGNVASKAGKVASIFDKVNKVSNIAGPTMQAINVARSGVNDGNEVQQGPTSAELGTGGRTNPGIGPSSNQAIGKVMPRGGYRYNENPMNQLDQSNPNLAQSIFQGKQQAIRNQPFRSGYDITSPNPDSTDAASLPPNVTRMPPIYGSSQRRRRNPAAESEVMY